MPTVLLVDDDEFDLIELIREELAHIGYTTIFATDGEGTLHQLAHEKPDIIVLDLKLPDIDGMLLISKIRLMSKVPIIVISGRTGQVDRVVALERGADDFIPKPFDLTELEARIAAVLRRSQPPPEIPKPQVGSLRISNARGAFINNRPFHLTPIEHRIVMTLVEHANDLVTREVLVQAVYGDHSDADMSRLMDVHINHIRTRMQRIAGAPVISTIRGRGFVIHQNLEQH